MSALLTEMISLLVGGITGIASGLGSGISTLVQSIFVTVNEAGDASLTTYGGLVVVFAGISLAIGISTKIFNWVTSLGAN